MTEQTTTPETPTKQPRAKWTDAMVLRLMANKPEGSAPQVLLTGLVACNIAHKTVDNALRAPEGTTLAYLKSGNAVDYEVQCDEGALPALLDDAAADAVIDKLVALKTAGAFMPRGLDLEAVLAVMLGTAALRR